MDPSVEPLSATITSPDKTPSAKARNALSTQMPRELASFRQGMTTETSGPGLGIAASVSVQDCVWPNGPPGAAFLCGLANEAPLSPGNGLLDRNEILADNLADQIGLAEPLLVGPALVFNHDCQ